MNENLVATTLANSKVEFKESLPKTVSGKIIRKKL